MRHLVWIVFPICAIGCGPPTPAHEHTEPLSAAEHQQQAEAHEQEAEVSTQQIESEAEQDSVSCIDQGVPLTIGGERVPVMKPCWTRAEQNAAYLRSAEAHRRAAAEHRAWAERLVNVEQSACAGLGEVERATDPFVRTPDILSVAEYREGASQRGAKVTFRKVSGLSKEWLVRSIHCHQARAAALGYDRDFMPHSPLVLKDTRVSVSETANTVVAILRSSDPVVAAEIYGRVSRLVETDASGAGAGGAGGNE